MALHNLTADEFARMVYAEMARMRAVDPPRKKGDWS